MKNQRRSKDEIAKVEEQIKLYVIEGRKLQGDIRTAKSGLIKIFYEALFVHNFSDEEFVILSRELGYTKSTRSKIKSIINNDVIMTNADSLPSSWGTLYLLRKLSKDKLTRLINDETLNANMSFREVKELLIEVGELTSKDNVVPLVDSGIFSVNFNTDDFTDEQVEAITAFQSKLHALVKPLQEVGIDIESTSIDLTTLMETEDREVA
jgi:hypothetical protein